MRNFDYGRVLLGVLADAPAALISITNDVKELDGHIGAFDGILECKCPKSATHLKYLRAGTVPSEYMPQILHNLWITGAAWCDFLSFDDRFPLPLQTMLVRVRRNEAELKVYELAASLFLSEVERETAEVAERAMVGVSR